LEAVCDTYKVKKFKFWLLFFKVAEKISEVWKKRRWRWLIDNDFQLFFTFFAEKN
jgi:hypothetical protein